MTFGLVPQRGQGSYRGRGAGRAKFRYRNSNQAKYHANKSASSALNVGVTFNDGKFDEVLIKDEIDEKMGFWRYREGPPRLGWLINMHPTLIRDNDWPTGRSAVDFYFIEEDGQSFKCTLMFEPYFYLACRSGSENDVEEYLRRKFEKMISHIDRVKKEDLKMPNHLMGYQRTFLQLKFRNVTDLLAIRREIMPIAIANRQKFDAVDAYAEVVSATTGLDIDDEFSPSVRKGVADAADDIVDIREYDIPYHLRVAIDNDFRVGLWYDVKAEEDQIHISLREDKIKRADPVVLAFDIETTKLPLKFPDSTIDSIMMISYMIDSQGYLITNREIVSEDINDFEYTPNPEYEGPFTIFNEPNEKAVIERFFEHISIAKPNVIVTYNGDFFDWPFVEARATVHGLDMMKEIGFSKDDQDEYKSRHCIHMDAFRWVKRDSYLPQGSQGLKAVTTAKLGYDPIELDPELMTVYAAEKPQVLAQYSVSDAVATYYLYMKYVHPFIFSLCNIIPLNPDEVLRKGSGTLCEVLLMNEAYKRNIIMPNKHEEKFGKVYEGHLLETETYVGGHVEALEAGVFRSDIATNFKIIPSAIQTLIDQLDAALKFSITVEGNLNIEDIENYQEVKEEIVTKLLDLRDNPLRNEQPFIYHLDVAAMYPNIILSNRLQPDAIVDEALCAACDFNRPGKRCDRRMTWSWRGEYFTAQADEVRMIQNALEGETFPSSKPGAPRQRYADLSESKKNSLLQARLSEYSRKSHGKARGTKVIDREAIICQRENPFYVNTVCNFRDRRYEYKGLHKTWKRNLDIVTSGSDITQLDEAKKMVVLYDSLQLAHKCILNSFYGYVMRKGARWYSMEMAGITCLTGAKIIQMARQIVEQIGRPLELDTDGIWCMLPCTFPENFKFKLKNGKMFGISYPCTMLNHLVHDRFTNDQYHDLVDADHHKYQVRSENSIFFEVDGPYRAMILPSSTEEDKLLKKRYAVFNDDGSLAELKGFELKRRGELKLVKIFQSQIFKVFLEGKTLQECYAAVAKVADRWLDVLYSKGASLEDNELFELISENRSMSKTLAEYGGQKSTSISTAKRLAEFLGDQMVKDKGLACKFVISSKPQGAPVTERAIPVAIFSAEMSVRKHFLRKWLKDNGLSQFDIRSILDWNYYLERFGSVVQKLITIPAAMQKVANPVPRIQHPQWLYKRVAAKDDKFKQHRITDIFTPVSRNDENRDPNVPSPADLEDFGNVKPSTSTKIALVKKRAKRKRNGVHDDGDLEDLPELGPAPDPKKDYVSWISYQRIKWKHQRKARIRRRRLFGSSSTNYLMRDPTTLTGIFRQQSEAMLGQTWEILQLNETNIPGEFRLWFIMGSQIQSVRLTVPRRFYVNLKDETRSDLFTERHDVQKVARVLPRTHTCYSLFQVTMSEQVFLDDWSRFSGLLNDSTVEGVYEMKLPLEIRAIMSLGNLCTINREKPEVLGRGFDQGFALEDLCKEKVPNTYLKTPFCIHYLYLQYLKSDSRSVLSLFFPEKKMVHIHLSDGNRTSPEIPDLEKLYRDRYADYQASRESDGDREEAFTYSADMQFDFKFFPNEQAALRAMSKTISQYISDKRAPLVMVVHSQEDIRIVSSKIKPLLDLPTIAFPSSAQENRFPPLQWQTYALKYTMAHYFHISLWIMERIQLARYADIPLCNMGPDPAVFLADIFFARRLVRNDLLLWWNPGGRPDLGGREFDDNVQTFEEVARPEINNAGCFSTVCLELRVMNLAVNAVLESAVVHELEGIGGSTITGFGNSSHNLDEYTSEAGLVGSRSDGSTISPQTFNMLKGMLKGWHIEMAQTRNRFAEMMVDHFYRWINCSTSAMFDPLLSKFIHGLMKKTIMQLLAEFRRLGSRVVYANFNRIMLLTSKPSAGHAFAYANYIVKAIMSKPLFQSIYLDIHNYWEILLWMDPANYGGYICKDPEADIDDDDNLHPSNKVICENWNMKLFLPPALRQTFDTFVSDFMKQLSQIKTETRGIAPSQTVKSSNTTHVENLDVTLLGEEEEEAGSAFVERARRLISHELASELLRVIPHIQHQQRMAFNDPQDKIMFEFPKLPGSHVEMKNPALQFVNQLMAVYGLGKDFSQEVRVLKRNLLNLLDVREFSPEATFRDPCASCKIESIICPMCNSADDLDLCRDIDLLPEMEIADGVNRFKHTRWLCRNPECRTEFDRQSIEERLVDMAQARATEYQLQDVRCVKCKRVKEENLLSYCSSCAGRFKTMIDDQHLSHRLRIMQNVAEFYGFELLKEVVGWLLLQHSSS